MITVARERHVAAAPERLWPLVSEVDRLPVWFSFAEKAELLEGKGRGRRQRIYGHWGKKQSQVDQLVTDFEPQRLLAWVHEAERLDGRPAPRFALSTRFSIELVAEGSGTRVVLTSAQEPAGALKGAAMRLFGKREIASNLEESLDRLERRAETAREGASGPSPTP